MQETKDAKGGTLHVALLQMHIEAGEPEANDRTVERMVEEAMNGPIRPDLLLLPELWNTGYALDRIRELADPDGARTQVFIGELCRRHNVMIVAGSVAAADPDGAVCNTLYAFDRQGHCSAAYSKIHLFRLMQEERALAPGGEPGRFDLEGVPCGALICYDIRFPELARTRALSGARVLLVPAEWPEPRLHHWRTLLQARAIENQLYVLACNRVGESGGAVFFGHSMIIDPWGEIVAEAGREETVLRAELRLELVEEVRKRIPVLEDRRPDLYRL